ncbi:unnamed protein product [Durusdinium trenchii]|uniref:Uncharacterized protein n=1 Tax=Durusdinium trenchii TaxID=1381693 RepID=A0ABP0NWL3_9DINO
MEGTPPTPPTPPEVTRMFQKMAGKISTSSSGSSSDSSSSSSSAGADQRTNTEGVAKETTPTADGEPGKAGQYQQQESDDEGKVAQLMKEQAKLGCNELEPWQNLRNASFAAREASKSKWPDGPRSYKELFGWADYNSQVLLSDLPDKQAHKSNLVALMSRGIQHHDAFSGLGTASIACKSQLQSMSRLLKQSAGPGSADAVPDADAAYECVTACDNDKIPQFVLCGLCKEHAPSHVQVSLEDRVSPEAIKRMRKIRADTEFELATEKGEMDLDDEVGAGERDKALTSKYGELLLDRFMNFLGSTPEIWKHKAVCIKHDPPTGKPLKRRSNEEQRECETPVGLLTLENGHKIRVASAGTTCADVSQFGAMAGLMGPSCESLALWLSERAQCLEDVIVHECTSLFSKDIFCRYLPQYEVHRPIALSGEDLMLSPHQLGWPLHRPRAYTVLTKRATVKLDGFNETLCSLFRKCMISVESLFVAPEEEVAEEKSILAKSVCKSASLPFAELLSGAKKVWLQGYKDHPKVEKYWNRGSSALLANLQQNPKVRPVVSEYCPTLLRKGMMFLILRPCSLGSGPVREERYLLPKETLNSMGHAQYAEFSGSGLFPIVDTKGLSPAAIRQLSGNAMHCAVVGTLWAVIMVRMEPVEHQS